MGYTYYIYNKRTKKPQGLLRDLGYVRGTTFFDHDIQDWREKPITYSSIEEAELAILSRKLQDICIVKIYNDFSWLSAEECKFLDGEYEKPSFCEFLRANFSEKFYYENRVHVVHIHKTDKEYISFIKNGDNGIRGIYTKMLPGKYLKKYYNLDDETIRLLVEDFTVSNSKLELKWAETPDEIEAVYSMNAGFESCMQGEYHADDYSTKEHPVRVYGAGDLSVAYLTKKNVRIHNNKPIVEDLLIARALVWKEAKQVGRMYGEYRKLQHALREYGIPTESNTNTYDMLYGARLLKKKVTMRNSGTTHYMAPYIDCMSSGANGGLYIGKKYLYRCRFGDTLAQNTVGITDTFCCYICERIRSTHYMQKNSVYRKEKYTSARICSRCVGDRHLFYCNNTKYYYPKEGYTPIQVLTFDGTQTWCMERTKKQYTQMSNGSYVQNGIDYRTINDIFLQKEMV